MSAGHLVDFSNMTIDNPEHSDLLADLPGAVEAKQFSLRYQPRLDCEVLTLKGFDALARWEHPTHGSIPPSLFIPLAEEAGLIGQITEQVVSQAFFWYAGTSGVPGLSMSINISAKRLGDRDFADWLKDMCRRAGIKPDLIILEISERAVMGERLLALDMFNRLKPHGFRVALDDFGTAEASLLQLAKLPFSEVKIDKTYAMNAQTSPEAKTFIRSTIERAHSMSLKVTIEGVEDRDTLDFIRGLGCDFVNGYLISPPLTGDEAHDWILNRRRMTRHLLV